MTTNTPPAWAARVEELLAKQGKSRAELADEIGVSTGYLTMLMLGTRQGHPAHLRHIADALGVPESWLETPSAAPAREGTP